MSKKYDELDQLWHKVNEEVARRDFLVFRGSISLGADMAIWSGDDDVGSFLDLARAVGSQIVYLKSRRLTPDELLDLVAVALVSEFDALDADSPEELVTLSGLTAHPVAVDYLRYGKKYYSRRLDVCLQWVHAGIVHRFSRYADWYTELTKKAGNVAELIDGVEEAGWE
jgi:hypothetical protein